MSAQELMALYRIKSPSCPCCKRIVSRYEKTLRLTTDDLRHLEGCLMRG